MNALQIAHQWLREQGIDPTAPEPEMPEADRRLLERGQEIREWAKEADKLTQPVPSSSCVTDVDYKLRTFCKEKLPGLIDAASKKYTDPASQKDAKLVKEWLRTSIHQLDKDPIDLLESLSQQLSENSGLCNSLAMILSQYTLALAQEILS